MKIFALIVLAIIVIILIKDKTEGDQYLGKEDKDDEQLG